MADGREAAGGLEEKGSAGLLQAGKAQAGHVAYGPADDELLGRGGMDGGDFFRQLQGPAGGCYGKVQQEEVEILILGESLEIPDDDLGGVHELVIFVFRLLPP